MRGGLSGPRGKNMLKMRGGREAAASRPERPRMGIMPPRRNPRHSLYTPAVVTAGKN